MVPLWGYLAYGWNRYCQEGQAWGDEKKRVFRDNCGGQGRTPGAKDDAEYRKPIYFSLL